MAIELKNASLLHALELSTLFIYVLVSNATTLIATKTNLTTTPPPPPPRARGAYPSSLLNPRPSGVIFFSPTATAC